MLNTSKTGRARAVGWMSLAYLILPGSVAYAVCPSQIVGFSKAGPSTAADASEPNNPGAEDPPNPTGDKPESKLWFGHSYWWAVMWDSRAAGQGGQRYRIFRNTDNAASNNWEPTSAIVSEATDRKWLRRYDVLPATDLFIASHEPGPAGANCSGSICNVRIYRFKWVAAPDYWRLDTDANFPKDLKDFNNQTVNAKLETLVIDKAPNGVVWATWTKKAGGPSERVHAARTIGACDGSSTSGDCDWREIIGTCSNNPTVKCSDNSQCSPGTCSFPQFFTNIKDDDISSLIGFMRVPGAPNPAKGAIGIMWSNQIDEHMHFAYHDDDSMVDTDWIHENVYSFVGVCNGGQNNGQSCDSAATCPGGSCTGGKGADDHINLKVSKVCAGGSAINLPCLAPSDCPGSTCNADRVLAATKTSRPDYVPPVATDPVILLQTRSVGGSWVNYVFGQVQDHHTRPILQIDERNECIHMFASRDEDSIVEKMSPLAASQMGFASGAGQVIMDTAAQLNNVTSTKQPIDPALNGPVSRLMVLVSTFNADDNAGTYRSYRECLCDDGNQCTDDACGTAEVCTNSCQGQGITCGCGGVCGNNCICGGQ